VEVDSRLVRSFRAAVVAVHLGERPPDAFVCHRCDNRACIAHDHLFWGTVQDNNVDCALKGRRRRWSIDLKLKLRSWEAELMALDWLLRGGEL